MDNLGNNLSLSGAVEKIWLCLIMGPDKEAMIRYDRGKFKGWSRMHDNIFGGHSQFVIKSSLERLWKS